MFCYICKVTNAQCTVTIGVLDSFVKASFTSLIQSMRSLDFLHGRSINALIISGARHGKIDCKRRRCIRKQLPVPVTIATLPRLCVALPRGRPGSARGHLIHSCTTKHALGMTKITHNCMRMYSECWCSCLKLKCQLNVAIHELALLEKKWCKAWFSNICTKSMSPAHHQKPGNVQQIKNGIIQNRRISAYDQFKKDALWCSLQ